MRCTASAQHALSARSKWEYVGHALSARSKWECVGHALSARSKWECVAKTADVTSADTPDGGPAWALAVRVRYEVSAVSGLPAASACALPASRRLCA
jgi:hypothetical protein